MSMSRPIRLLVLLLAALFLASAAPAAAMPPTTAPDGLGLRTALDVMRQLATDASPKALGKTTTKPKKGLPIKLGKDRRLTILLIGSDWRKDSGGERFDVIMVATIDPRTGKAAVVSIPRDMSGIPLAGGGDSGSMRVNSIYFIRYRDSSLPHAAIDRKAVKRFSKDIATFLGTEIDYWALLRFADFARLINKLGGVRVDIKEEVLDSSYHHNSTKGIWFPARDNYRLLGNPDCKPGKKCRSALVYVRSRKGTVGSSYNSDYRRAERQQLLVRAAVKQVIDDDGSGLVLLGRLLSVRDKIATNLPKTTEAAAQLYALLEDMKLPRANMKVLAPGTWAGLVADGTTKPKLSTIRSWVKKHFYKVKAPKAKAKAEDTASVAAGQALAAAATEG